MKRATKQDRSAVVQILSRAFEDNRSVNFIVRQDSERLLRLDRLMEFCFLTCLDFGKVFLDEDRKSCALVLFPDRKRTSWAGIFRELKMVFFVVGIGGIFKVLRRESLVKKRHPSGGGMFYIWFVGCVPEAQGKGRGTQMMEFLLSEAERMNRKVYLETSVERNVPWYTKLGLQVYDELDLGYRLYFLKN
uniref:GNAT family N-acetyltransferase n=1 Tax=Pedobacter schmidteae TaxID=2201271 RepID=UPI000EAE6C74|nr:GNAT family N-acetyltransferase [Pedobacter schmidteae]